MSLFKNITGFFHSLTTYDHYAAYDGDEQPKPSTTHHPNASSQSISMLDNTSTASLHQQPRGSTNSGRPSVSYRPGLRTQMSQRGDIQLSDYMDGQPALPSISDIWERLDNWLEREFPELGDDMDSGVTVNDLNAFEKDLSISLPLDIRDSYQIHDGQLSFGKTRGLIYSYPLMDLESVAAETNIWRKAARVMADMEAKETNKVSHQSSSSLHQKMNKLNFVDRQGSCPQGAIQPMYYNPGWIPLVKDGGGNNIAVDLNPGPRGRYGQIILYGRDFDTKFLVAGSFTEFLLNLTQDLEDGKFTIDEVDEDLLFMDRGRTFPYFQVLRSRAIAAEKAALKKLAASNSQNNNGSKNASQVDLGKLPSTGLSNSKISLPRETLISPITSSTTLNKKSQSPLPATPTTNISLDQQQKPHEPSKLKDDFTPPRFEAPTNDSFVLEEEDDDDNESIIASTGKEDKSKPKQEEPKLETKLKSKIESKPETKVEEKSEPVKKSEKKEESKEDNGEKIKEEPKQVPTTSESTIESDSAAIKEEVKIEQDIEPISEPAK